jgi:hypothetical protein
MPLPGIVASNLIPLGALAPIVAPPGPLGGSLPATPPGAAARSLAFTMHPQEQSNWCWAAVGVSVARFFNSSTIWQEQCDLTSQELVQVCCPTGTNPTGCNVPWYLDQALIRVGHYNPYQSRAASLNEIRAEIDSNRPLGVRIAWSSGGGHFVVVSGYSTSPVGDMVTIEDPVYGQSILLLSTFTTAYQGSGSWTHSYWTG